MSDGLAAVALPSNMTPMYVAVLFQLTLILRMWASKRLISRAASGQSDSTSRHHSASHLEVRIEQATIIELGIRVPVTSQLVLGRVGPEPDPGRLDDEVGSIDGDSDLARREDC
jgi:hypothetical protein